MFKLFDMVRVRQVIIRKKRYDEAKKLLLAEIEKAFLNGEQELEILHGIGEYKLRNMIFAECQKIDYAEVIAKDEIIRHNDGVTKIKILSLEKSILEEYVN